MSQPLFTRHQEKEAPRCSLMPKGRPYLSAAAFHNAETVDMALGCSTNTMLHLPAIAHEAHVELNLDMTNEFMSFLVRTSELNAMSVEKRLVTPAKQIVRNVR